MDRRLLSRAVWPACLLAIALGHVGGRSLAEAPARALAQTQTPPPQTPPATQQPQFRGEVNVIRLDVSVLDKDRKPVRGLTLEDFTVFENGARQQIVAVSAVDVADQDPAPSAWMRHTTRDMVTNDLVDQVGDGRVYAIVIDDWNLPWDDPDITILTRSAARYIVDGLGPSDVAAIVFPQDAGLSQDFTSDRVKLLEAIDKYNPHERPWIYDTPIGPGPGGADMPQRFSPALARSLCQRTQPTVPTLRTVAARMASVPERRKTMVLVSTGVPLQVGAARGCPGELADIMKDVFRIAERANINIHPVDPTGYGGYESYLRRPRLRGRNMGEMASDDAARGAARLRKDFMQITASETGGRAVVQTDSIESGIDKIFDEDASYYLVGFQTSNGAPDCKYRKLEVKVNRPGVDVRTRAGYYAMCAERLQAPDARLTPGTGDLGMAGLFAPAGLPLRAVAIPLGPAREPGKVDVGVVLTVKLPASPTGVNEKLTVTRHLYDATGKPGPPLQDTRSIFVPRSGNDELRYDVHYTWPLAPGRYEIRLNAKSQALDRNGSVYVPVEVPDLTRPAIALGGLWLGTRPLDGAERADPFGAALPIVPTTARDFEPNVRLAAAVRLQLAAAAPSAGVAIETRLVDANDRVSFEKSDVMPATQLQTAGGGMFVVDVPFDGLERGPYVLSLKATLPDGRSTRRDVVFRVR